MSQPEIDADEPDFEDSDIEWDDEPAGPSLVTRMIAELVGTFVFILLALGAAMFADGRIVVALGFALPLWAVVVAIGRVSGAHVNPAITVGAWLAGRFPGRDVAPYVLAQTIGATAAGATLWGLIASNPQVEDASTIMSNVANGYGDYSPTQFPLAAGGVTEVLATGMFVAAVLAATSVRAIPALTAPTIGLALGALHLFQIPFTNASLNPARSTGAALFAEGWALEQLWLFWLAPLIGAVVVGLLFRAFGPEEDLVSHAPVEAVDVDDETA